MSYWRCSYRNRLCLKQRVKQQQQQHAESQAISKQNELGKPESQKPRDKTEIKNTRIAFTIITARSIRKRHIEQNITVSVSLESILIPWVVSGIRCTQSEAWELGPVSWELLSGAAMFLGSGAAWEMESFPDSGIDMKIVTVPTVPHYCCACQNHW